MASMAGRQLLLVVVVSFSASCVSVKEPMLVSKDTYMLSTRSMFASNAKSLGATLKSANAFCAAKGLNFSLQGSDMSPPPLTGGSRENNVIFKCLPDNNSADASHEPQVSK